MEGNFDSTHIQGKLLFDLTRATHLLDHDLGDPILDEILPSFTEQDRDLYSFVSEVMQLPILHPRPLPL